MKPFQLPKLHHSPRALTLYRRAANSRTSDARLAVGGDRPSDWMSGRNIDLCLLAVCSCVLSLLCHQGVGVMSPTSTSGINTASTTPAQVDFLVKAGLLTTSRQEPEVSESDDSE
ncbi:MAG: hypothetical protein WBA57_19055 [Elainellaceae cyanobacterium]